MIKFIIFGTLLALSTVAGTTKTKGNGDMKTEEEFIGKTALELRVSRLETLITQQERQQLQNDLTCSVVEDCESNVAMEERMSALEMVVENQAGLIEEQTGVIEEQAMEIKSLRGDVADLNEKIFPGKIPASCHEYAQRGEATNGIFPIRPSADIAAFEVFCDFSVGQGMTVVSHDHDGYGITSVPGQSDGCQEAGCFEDQIKYGPDMAQIESLMAISADCHQSILHNCTNNALTNLSWWVDRNGIERQYWHGSFATGSTGCFCSIEGEGCEATAAGDETLCNCDASGDLKIDNGLLSAMDQLPVTQLNFGGGSNRFSWILYKLGFLECNGKAELAQYPSETIDNKIDAVIDDIADLTMTSEVHATSIKTLETTTSNQGASINHLQSDVAGLEKETNRDDYFFNYRLSSTQNMVAGILKFTYHISGNTNNGYNPATGIFLAPEAGRYSFKLHIIDYNTAQTGYHYSIQFRVNGSTKYQLYGTSTQYSFNLDSRHFSVEYNLTKNDQVDFNVFDYSGTQFHAYSFIEGKLEK